jgi:hypothetical protein
MLSPCISALEIVTVHKAIQSSFECLSYVMVSLRQFPPLTYVFSSSDINEHFIDIHFQALDNGLFWYYTLGHEK